MNLGESIYRLRTRQQLSQGDLADALEVSRQSISKWENNNAVPELDKLVKMSDLFGVTLDELIRGTPPAPPEAPAAVSPPAPAGLSGRKVAGIVLLCMAFLVVLVFTLMGSFPVGLLFATPFVACGVICLTVARHTGLWCGWAAFFLVDVYFRYGTGVTWHLALMTIGFQPEWNYMRLAIAWAELILAAALLAATVLALGRRPLEPGRKQTLLTAAGWAALVVVHFALNGVYQLFQVDSFGRWIHFIFADWVRLGLLAAALTRTLRLLRGRRGRKPA